MAASLIALGRDLEIKSLSIGVASYRLRISIPNGNSTEPIGEHLGRHASASLQK
jgi:hypothetical protein